MSSATVLVFAVGRDGDLDRCLARLEAQRTSRSVEVLLVRTSSRTSDGDPPVARSGGTVLLPAGANRSQALALALERARGEVLVLLDADLDVADDWLDRLLDPFDDASVAVVTGSLLLPDLSDLESQLLLDHGALDAGAHRLRLEPDAPGRPPALPPGTLSCAAIRAEWAGKLADVRSPHPDGSEGDLLTAVLDAGGEVQYEPTARAQRRAALDRRAVSTHLRAVTAAQVASALELGRRRGDRRGWRFALVQLPGQLVGQVRATRLGDDSLPGYVVMAQLRGAVDGVGAFLRGRSAWRSSSESAP